MKKLKLPTAAPTLFNTLYEARCIVELMGYLTSSSKRRASDIPAGDGRPILVIPGFLCSDLSTWALRRFLRTIGYRSFSWKQGVNWGPKPGVRTRLLHRLSELRARHDEPVTVIGWSLGGFYARELACIRPDLIREVITLGSPLHGSAQSTAVWNAFLWLNRKHQPQIAYGGIDFPIPHDVPCLSIFTKGDGIVPWELCVPQRGRSGRHLQVEGSHIGLVFNPEVMRLLGLHLGREPKVRSSTRVRRRRGARSASQHPSSIDGGRIAVKISA